MKIAFLHYHLKTGGVTTVIKQQMRALQGSCEMLALTGTLPERDIPADTVEIPGLAYDSDGAAALDPRDTADAVWEAIQTKWGSGCDVLHVHNPTLAKNKHLLQILKALQEKGVRLFLQIHDFSEDGRPGAYFADSYPENCHYGVINSRDHRILLNAGLRTNGLHLLPNTVLPLPDVRRLLKDDERHILYPIRAIRRKNIGEAILLSQLITDRLPLCITLPPNSPADFPSYEFWKEYTARHNMAIMFEAGLKENFKDLVRFSRFMITTSITEGFGFSFLEPWTAGKYLCGRRLPDICVDFEQSGICLEHLYSRIDIPLDWIDEAAFREDWEACFTAAFQNFGRPKRPDLAASGYGNITKNGRVDLGLLSEPFQEQVLSTLLGRDNAKARLFQMNPRLGLPRRGEDMEALISRNREAVTQHYNETIYRTNLIGIYERVSSTPVSHSIDKQFLLNAFLTPEMFSLLKWSTFPDPLTE